MIKLHKKLKIRLILTGVYLILAAVISISVIAAINNSIVIHIVKNNFIAQTNNATNIENTTESSGKPSVTVNLPEIKLTSIPDDAINLSFSFDGKYCVYLYNNSIYIKDINADKTVNQISDNTVIANFTLMNDRNRIIYFTIKDTSLNINTFDIENNIGTFQKTINIPAGAIIKYVEYSSSLNQILINVESGKGTNLISRIYRINLMKAIYTLGISSEINKMVLLNDTYCLYFEDKNNNLYCYPEPVTGFNKKKIHLLGNDLNDNVYVQSLENKNIIYVLKNKKIEKTINLTDPSYTGAYSNKLGVYLIYKNYILNLAGDINKKMLFDKDLKFTGIGGDKIFFRDTKDNIIFY